MTNGISEQEFGAVEITADGEAIVRTGSLSHGPGPRDDVRADRGRRLGLPIEKVTVIQRRHRRRCRAGPGTYGSKSTQIGGVAAGQASEEVVEKGKALAADLLEADPEDIVLDVERRPLPRRRRPAAVARLGASSRRGSTPRTGSAELSAEVDFQAAQPTFPFGAHVAVVEVDTETGAVELSGIVAVDDAAGSSTRCSPRARSTAGSPQGIAQALFEEIAYDADGNPLTPTSSTTRIPAAAELPPFEVVNMETPTPLNPLGREGHRRVGHDRRRRRRCTTP